MVRSVVLAAVVIGCCLGCDADTDSTAQPVVSTSAPAAPRSTPPTPTPTAPQCIDDADVKATANQFVVSELIFSGQRDPTWKLTVAQSRELRAKILRTKNAARGLDEMVGMPGDAGFIVRASTSQGEFLAKAGLEHHFWVPYGDLGDFLTSTRPCSVFGTKVS